jgi:hypothetical protein
VFRSSTNRIFATAGLLFSADAVSAEGQKVPLPLAACVASKLELEGILPSAPQVPAALSQSFEVFSQNFNAAYTPRYCRGNIESLISLFKQKGIELNDAHVLKFEGPGVWETSGFYTRYEMNERVNLGTWHFVLVKGGYVFDFDLWEPKVLPLEDYIRLQFTPPTEPYFIARVNRYNTRDELKFLKVTRYEVDEFLKSPPAETWKKLFGEIVDVDAILARPRVF